VGSSNDNFQLSKIHKMEACARMFAGIIVFMEEKAAQIITRNSFGLMGYLMQGGMPER